MCVCECVCECESVCVSVSVCVSLSLSCVCVSVCVSLSLSRPLSPFLLTWDILQRLTGWGNLWVVFHAEIRHFADWAARLGAIEPLGKGTT